MKRLVDQFNFKNKTVLVRTDYNVPIQAGQIQNNMRIRASLGVIRALIMAGVKSFSSVIWDALLVKALRWSCR